MKNVMLVITVVLFSSVAFGQTCATAKTASEKMMYCDSSPAPAPAPEDTYRQTICPDADPSHCYIKGPTSTPKVSATGEQATLTVDRTLTDKGREMVVGHDQRGGYHNLLCFQSRPDCLPLVRGQAYPASMVANNDPLAYPVKTVTLVGAAGTDLTCSYHLVSTAAITINPQEKAVYGFISTIDEGQAAAEGYVTGQNLLCHPTTAAERYSADHSSPKEQAELAKACKAQGHEWTNGQCIHNQWDAASTAGDRMQQADIARAKAQASAKKQSELLVDCITRGHQWINGKCGGKIPTPTQADRAANGAGGASDH